MFCSEGVVNITILRIGFQNASYILLLADKNKKLIRGATFGMFHSEKQINMYVLGTFFVQKPREYYNVS